MRGEAISTEPGGNRRGNLMGIWNRPGLSWDRQRSHLGGNLESMGDDRGGITRLRIDAAGDSFDERLVMLDRLLDLVGELLQSRQALEGETALAGRPGALPR